MQRCRVLYSNYLLTLQTFSMLTLILVVFCEHRIGIFFLWSVFDGIYLFLWIKTTVWTCLWNSDSDIYMSINCVLCEFHLTLTHFWVIFKWVAFWQGVRLFIDMRLLTLPEVLFIVTRWAVCLLILLILDATMEWCFKLKSLDIFW